MSKKGVVVSLIIASLVCIGFVVIKGKTHKGKIEVTSPDKDVVQKLKSPERKIKPTELHSDILRLIESAEAPVANISKDMAKKELEARAGIKSSADQKASNVATLPFEIVRMIAKSPATIAGVNPKIAVDEIIRRSLLVEDTDLGEGITPSLVLKSYKSQSEQASIDAWAKNEDAEAIEEFMKEQADNDPSSIANLAYGLRIKGKNPESKTYLDRYVARVGADAFDNPDEKKSHQELAEIIKKLK